MSRPAHRATRIASLLCALAAGIASAQAGDGNRGGRESFSADTVSRSGFERFEPATGSRSRERFGSVDVGPVVVGGGSFVSTRRYLEERRGTQTFDARSFELGQGRSFDGRTSYASDRDWNRRAERARERYERGNHGSFAGLRDTRRADREERNRRFDRNWARYGRADDGRSTLTTFDDRDWRGGSSIVTYGVPMSYDATASLAGPSINPGPKIIDVATERLDRRPIGPSGLDIVDTGGAKIIRIAPGYRLANRSAPRERDATVRGLGRQPWSAAWLSHCSRAHATFDPDLGTYVAANGKVRFCNAE